MRNSNETDKICCSTGRIAMGLFTALLLAACQKTVESRLPSGAVAYDTISRGAVAVAPSAYILRRGDRIEVRVFREPDFSTEDALVDISGNIYLPLVGEIQAAGLTQPELNDRIVRVLGERYLRDPRVTVAIKEAAASTVSIEGDVTMPGVFEVEPDYTLLTALALAQSPTDTARLDNVAIFRTINGQRAGARFDIADIRAGAAPDPAIVAGDVVVVGFSQRRRLYQDLLKAAPLLNVFYAF